MSEQTKSLLEAEVAADASAVEEAKPARWRQLATTPILITLVFLLGLIVIFSILAPGKFGTTSNITQLAQNVAILTVVSVGTTFIIATAGIDLSIPSGIILGEVFAAQMLSKHPRRPAAARRSTSSPRTPQATYILAALAAALVGGSADRGDQRRPGRPTCASRRCWPPWAPWVPGLGRGPADAARASTWPPMPSTR